jgi:flagellar biosynthesis protein FlhF
MIRRYRSTDLQKAIEQIKEELGEDALIIETRSFREESFGLLGREVVEVLAVPGRNRTLEKLSKPLLGVYRLLIEQGVCQEIVNALLDDLKDKGIKDEREVLEEVAKIMLKSLPPTLNGNGKASRRILVLLGQSGVGKTTTALKLATLAKEKGKKVSIISLDSERIGSFELLRLCGKILELEVELASEATELQKLLLKHREKDLIVVDTPAFPFLKSEKLKALLELKERAEFYLLISATTREEEAFGTMRRLEKIPFRGLIFTKLDEATRFGPLFNLALKANLPLSYFTTGPRVPEDIEKATKIRLVDLVLHLSSRRLG